MLMTPSQRYFFDVAGYLHIKNALTEKELSDGRLACERYMKLEDNQFPDGFGNVGEYGWGGAGSTVYFCDKKEKIVVVFMTELLQGRLNMKRRIKECLYGVSFPKKSRSTKARL